MTIEKIKYDIDKRLGDNVKIVYYGSRNKREEYTGVIAQTYNYIFIIKMNGNDVKSFSYSDVLTKTIKVIFEDGK